MEKQSKFLPIFCLTALLIIASLAIAGCGDATPISMHEVTIRTSVYTNTATPKTPAVPTATAVPAATPTPGEQTTLKTQVTVTDNTAAPNVAVAWNASPSTMYTLNWVNMRSGPSTDAQIVKSMAPSLPVTVYGTVNGSTNWARVSDQNSSPLYIYSGLLSVTKPVPATPTPAPVATAAPVAGPAYLVKVDLTAQHAYAYQNGTLVHDNLITSGRPELMTPVGTFKIFSKVTNVTFYPNSAWQGTPLWYSPEHINYALQFTDSGVFLHDATWRAAGDFGPGTEVPHTAPDGTQATGSHGCVNMTLADAQWYYNWAPIGTTVIVYY